MGGTIAFSVEEVKELVEHVKGSKKFRKPYGEGEEYPALWFVHDQGLYLMSNGEPPQKGEKEGKLRVAYADGFDPSKGEFEDWWDGAREIVGGDDFVEPIPVEDFEGVLSAAEKAGKDRLFMLVTPTSLELSV